MRYKLCRKFQFIGEVYYGENFQALKVPSALDICGKMKHSYHPRESKDLFEPYNTNGSDNISCSEILGQMCDIRGRLICKMS